MPKTLMQLFQCILLTLYNGIQVCRCCRNFRWMHLIKNTLPLCWKFFLLEVFMRYFKRHSSSPFWTNSNLLQWFSWIFFSVYLLWGKQIVSFCFKLGSFWKGYNRKISKKPMTFQVNSQRGAFIHWDKKTSATLLGNRIHPM